MADHAGRPHRRSLTRALAALGCWALAAGAPAQSHDRPLTVTKAHRGRAPVVRSQILPGAPIPWSGSPVLTPPTLSIVDGETRFLTEGPAEERCPGDRVLFVPGVVNAYRSTVPGDGAFMCHRDAVAEGFVGP